MSEHIGPLTVTDKLMVSGSDFNSGITTHTIPALTLNNFQNANGWEKQHSSVTSTLTASGGNLQLRSGGGYDVNGWIHRSMKSKNGIWRYRFNQLNSAQIVGMQDADNMVGLLKVGDKFEFFYELNGSLTYQNFKTIDLGSRGDRFDRAGGTNIGITFDFTQPGEIIIARYDDYIYFAICEENGRLVASESFTDSRFSKLDIKGFGVGKSSRNAQVDVLEAEFTSISDKGLQQFIAIGDSQTWGQKPSGITSNRYNYAGLGEGWVNYLYQHIKGQNKIVRQQGMPGGSTHDILADYDRHTQGLHRDINTTVLFYVGINDFLLSSSETAAGVFTRWQQLVTRLVNNANIQKVLAFTIPTTNTTRWVRAGTNDKIRELNKLIIENASKIGYEVYDIYQISVSPTNENELRPGYVEAGSGDGVHFGIPAHLAFAENLRPQTLRRVRTGENIGGDLNSVAEAFTSSLDSKLAAQRSDVGESNIGKTAHTVLLTSDGKVQIGSADDGNIVDVFQTGKDKSLNKIKETVFLEKGEVKLLTGLEPGSIISSTRGINGVSGCVRGGNLSPMPLAPEGMAGRHFFFFMFRSGTSGAGRAVVATGAIDSVVALLSGDGKTIIDGPVKIPAFSTYELKTNADAEFQVKSDQNIYVGLAADMNGPNYRDLRLLPPLATELIGHTNSAKISALYKDTKVKWYTRDGRSGELTVSPGTAGNLATAAGGGTDYTPAKAVILRASGPISCYAGADGLGTEASAFMPLNMLSQRVPIPMATTAAGRNRSSSIFIASPYKGTAKIYGWNTATPAQLQLVATVPLSRSVADPTAAQQNNPCAGIYGPDAGSTVRMTANLLGGYIESDVPIHVVMNSDNNQTLITSGISTADDETELWGVTPSDIKTTVRRDADGVLRRQVIANDGTVTWPKC